MKPDWHEKSEYNDHKSETVLILILYDDVIN